MQSELERAIVINDRERIVVGISSSRLLSLQAMTACTSASLRNTTSTAKARNRVVHAMLTLSRLCVGLDMFGVSRSIPLGGTLHPNDRRALECTSGDAAACLAATVHIRRLR